AIPPRHPQGPEQPCSLPRGEIRSRSQRLLLQSLTQDQRKLREAEQMLRRTVAGLQAALGQEHPRCMHALSNLACCLADQNRLAEAEELHRQAVEGCRCSLGDEHPDTRTVTESLASFLSACGRPAEAALTVCLGAPSSPYRQR
ncbi:unnamed protein product, partial [Polarella glacialis]